MSPKTVLIVEDDPMVLMASAEHLRDAGMRVVEAASGEQAEAILRASEHPVGALFTDIEMPGAVDGLALARTVCDCWPSVAVVVTSGRVAPTPAELSAGVVFVSKPYDIISVAALLQESVK